MFPTIHTYPHRCELVYCWWDSWLAEVPRGFQKQWIFRGFFRKVNFLFILFPEIGEIIQGKRRTALPSDHRKMKTIPSQRRSSRSLPPRQAMMPQRQLFPGVHAADINSDVSTHWDQTPQFKNPALTDNLLVFHLAPNKTTKTPSILQSITLGTKKIHFLKKPWKIHCYWNR